MTCGSAGRCLLEMRSGILGISSGADLISSGFLVFDLRFWTSWRYWR
jgi:hypothetical protein